MRKLFVILASVVLFNGLTMVGCSSSNTNVSSGKYTQQCASWTDIQCNYPVSLIQKQIKKGDDVNEVVRTATDWMLDAKVNPSVVRKDAELIKEHLRDAYYLRYYITPVLSAALRHDAEAVKLLIENGADINAPLPIEPQKGADRIAFDSFLRKQKNTTASEIALLYNDVDAVKILLDYGGNLFSGNSIFNDLNLLASNFIDPEITRYWYQSILDGRERMVNRLHDKNVPKEDIDKFKEYYAEGLNRVIAGLAKNAITYENETILNMIAQSKIPPEVFGAPKKVGFDADSDFLTAIIINNRLDILKQMMKDNEKLNLIAKSPDLLAVLAANFNRHSSCDEVTEIMDQLIKAGANVDAVYGRESAIEYLARIGNGCGVKQLMDAGAKYDGNQLLNTMISRNSDGRDAIRRLFEAGYTVSGLDGSALENALKQGNYVSASVLAEFNAKLPENYEVTQKDVLGAAEVDHSEALLKLLLKDKTAKLEFNRKHLVEVAIRSNSSANLKALMSLGYNVNDRITAVGETALMVAAAQGNLDCFYELLNAGADIQLSDDSGLTALNYASSGWEESRYSKINSRLQDVVYDMFDEKMLNAHIEIVRELLKRGASVHTKSPLLLSVKYSQIADILADAGADILTNDKNNEVMLKNAIELRHGYKLVKRMLDAGVGVNSIDLEHYWNFDDVETLQLLKERGHNAGNTGILDLYLFESAVYNLDIDLVKKMIDNGTDPKKNAEEFDISPMAIVLIDKLTAIVLNEEFDAKYLARLSSEQKDKLRKLIDEEMKRCDELLKLLTENQYVLNKQDVLLLLRYGSKYPAFVEELKAYVPDVQLGSLRTLTAYENSPEAINAAADKAIEAVKTMPPKTAVESFKLVLKTGDIDRVQKYINNGFDVNAADSDTYSLHPNVLSQVAFFKEGKDAFLIAVLERLVNAGADVNMKYGFDNDVSALSLAAVNASENVVAELIKYGADVNGADNNGYTPLMDAVKRGNIGNVRVLLEAGADLNAVNERNETALQIAKDYEYEAIIQLISEFEAKKNAQTNN